MGAIGSAAALCQEYITQVPLNHFVTDTQLAIIGAVLFTLAFWFRRLSSYNS